MRRRRRLSNTGSPRRNGGGNGINPWVITIFAALVVIVGGWFLGQALARVFNGPPKTERVAQAPTSEPLATPPVSPSPSASIAPTASPQPTATASKKPKPTPEPSPTATPNVTVAPSETTAPTATPAPTPATTATPEPAATPAPARHTQPIARRTEPTSSPAPQAEGPGTRVVREYIGALRSGDPATASTYLGNGSPDETFIDSSTRITSISESANGDGSYKVAVDMHTSKGEYYETFTVASGKILEKTAIKP